MYGSDVKVFVCVFVYVAHGHAIRRFRQQTEYHRLVFDFNGYMHICICVYANGCWYVYDCDCRQLHDFQGLIFPKMPRYMLG